MCSAKAVRTGEATHHILDGSSGGSDRTTSLEALVAVTACAATCLRRLESDLVLLCACCAS